MLFTMLYTICYLYHIFIYHMLFNMLYTICNFFISHLQNCLCYNYIFTFYIFFVSFSSRKKFKYHCDTGSTSIKP